MTTRKQIEANRRNSRSSTGPQTRTGKAESRMNAMKHGLLAEHIVVRGEDPAKFASLHESLMDEFFPRGSQEEYLVERVAVCMWRLRRVYRIEAGIMTHESLMIEFDRARNETKIFEQDMEEKLFAHPSEVQITNKKRHSRATAQAESARQPPASRMTWAIRPVTPRTGRPSMQPTAPSPTSATAASASTAAPATSG